MEVHVTLNKLLGVSDPDQEDSSAEVLVELRARHDGVDPKSCHQASF